MNKEEIVAWLKSFDIERYELIPDEKYGYIINVKGHVNICGTTLKVLPVKFNMVSGDFDIYDNQLETLAGCPIKVGGDFTCHANGLKSLRGGPIVVKKDFFCYSNQLQDLEDCPEFIGGSMNASFNNLRTLQYFPKTVKKDCYLSENLQLGYLQNIYDFKELEKVHLQYVKKIELAQQLEQDLLITSIRTKIKI